MKKENEAINMRDILRVFWSCAKEHKGKALVALLFTAAAEIVQGGVIPLLSKRFVDTFAAGTGIASAVPFLWRTLGFFVLARFAVVISLRLKFLFTSNFQTKVMASLERLVFSHTLKQSPSFFADTFAGSLVKKISRFSRAFESLADIFMLDLWGLLFVLGSMLFIVVRIDPLVAAVMLFWVMLMTAANLFFLERRKEKDEASAALDSASSGHSSDVFSNALSVKLFAASSLETRRFSDISTRLYEAVRQVWNVTEQADFLRGFLLIVFEGTIFAYGISRWRTGALTVGDMFLFQSVIFTLNQRASYIGRILRQLYRATADAKEAVALLNTVPAIQDRPDAKALKVVEGRIVFSDNGFSYAKSRILRGFSLSVAPREKVALVGPSGAGKSTVVKLLLRFYDLDQGSITIDGQDIAAVTQDSLRLNIALVPQDPALFHRSIHENIAYGKKNASRKDVIAAAKKAHCHEFISKLPQGYDTMVGERGVKLSGGERQRVAIARAILKDAPILVLDEATSALDSESESLIQDALHELMKDKTVIVIAHRLSTIMQMDRIVVMKDGEVSDMGTHDELLKKVGTYQTLWNIQAGGFKNGR